MTPAVGFDLDMTLIDSRPGIRATYRALTARTGVHVDADLAASRLGPPLRTELAHWFPPADIERAVTVYRELYAQHAIAPTVAMPGAEAALDAVRNRGLRVVVVTSKIAHLARMHLDHLGIAADELAGDLFAEGKAAAVTEHGVRWYVGDHVADMAAARAAEVPGIAVATGPCSPAELRAAGAAHVLPDLRSLPDLLSGIVVGSGRAAR
ncbi:HAD family hydrolase [Mangrovihabitans endophyticus]|uniref:Hydrolase n=1 Tax=Mangrovihabitans endophyticus TaxID=1751298 RepID=A0A8J3BZV4_9ACTN|nr:haloacid dehalogenase-like hydrolase [Mangrovihabitans endophyticus]GGK98547.1 hydrolase [Mangrovihabitans endophyticus]